MQEKNVQVNISTGTIVKIALIGLLLVFLYLIKEVLGIVFIAWVLASGLDPLIDRLQRHKIPRAISILGIYFVMILLLVLIFYLLIPPLAEQVKEIALTLPEYINQVTPGLMDSQGAIMQNIDSSLKYLSENLGNLTSGIYTALSSVIGAIAALLIILVIAFYMTVDEEGIKHFFKSVAPPKYQPYIIRKINHIQRKMGSWLWGQIMLMIIVGLLSGLSLWILGIKYFLVLGLIAAVCEVIPIVGPIVAALPAIFFAFADQPIKALLVIIIYVVIQQVENQVLVPKIMHKAVGLNPIIVLVTMLIGATVAGLPGVILAVPTATIIGIFLEDFFEGRKEDQAKFVVDDE